MFELKPLSATAVQAALEKAERYRLLNEPTDAESICRDVLDVEPANQEALINLILALTDQLGVGHADRVREAHETAAQLQGRYEKAYYSGIICERAAKSHHRRGTPASGTIAYELLRQAMNWFETAEKVRPPGNDDAPLRWHTCAPFIMRPPDIKAVEAMEAVVQVELGGLPVVPRNQRRRVWRESPAGTWTRGRDIMFACGSGNLRADFRQTAARFRLAARAGPS